MSELQILNSEGFRAIRTVTVDGEQYFCLADIYKMLEHAESSIEKPNAMGASIAPMYTNRETQNRIAIQRTLNQIGMPHNLKGYMYFVSAIGKCIEDRGKLNHIIKGLYVEIAEEKGDTVSRVERALRHAIEISWKRGNMKVIDNLFGYTISSEKGKPTNSEFIAYLTDFISLHCEEIVDGAYLFDCQSVSL